MICGMEKAKGFSGGSFATRKPVTGDGVAPTELDNIKDAGERAKIQGELPLRFAEGTDLSPVMGWTLTVNVAQQRLRVITVTNGRLTLVPRGFIISFR